jgi:hypothetical protein
MRFRTLSIFIVPIGLYLVAPAAIGQETTPEKATTMRHGASHAPPTLKELDDAATPIVDLEAPAPTDEARIAKSKRYDRQAIVKPNLAPSAVAIVVSGSAGDSDLPAADSDLVVEGTVTASEAFLSNDRGSVYSEFTVHVTDTLKVAPGINVHAGDTIAAERWGGRVRYPNGRIVRYGFTGLGSLRGGRKYLLFLAAAGAGNYRILTAYDVHGSDVRAVDGSNARTRPGNWSADKHNGQKYGAFRADVDAEIKNPHPVKRFLP